MGRWVAGADRTQTTHCGISQALGISWKALIKGLSMKGADMRGIRWLWIVVLMMLSTPAAAQTLSGWSDLSGAINRTPNSNIESLNGRRFDMKLENTEASGLLLSPAEAFSIKKTERGFTIEIVNARALTHSIQGFDVKVPISWEARIADETRFPVSIEGIDQCVFNLNFRQTGGEILDLTDLAKNFEIKWAIDNQPAVATSAINGRSLTLTRAEGNNSDVNIRLQIKSSDGSIDVASQAVPLPKCSRFLRDTRGEESIVQLRTPGQCVVMTRRKADESSTPSNKRWDFDETYANSCDRPVVCSFRWSLWRYTSPEEGVARRNAIFLNEMKRNDVYIAANGTTMLTAALETDWKNAPYYSWGKNDLPDGALTDYRNPDVVCRWYS